MKTGKHTHYHRPIVRPFVRSERESTTILIGGLSSIHERYAGAAVRSLGYRCQALPTPDVQSYLTGKEYQNNAYCNPAYFTVGNLVKYLQELETNGMSREEIVERYVFVTAGSCGTCRFGMYEEEYQLALRNAGFPEFRILTFGIDRAPDQGEEGAGLEMNFDFFMALANALNLADIVNQLACQIRPYEVRTGQTNLVLERINQRVVDTLERRTPYTPSAAWQKVFNAFGLINLYIYLTKIAHQLRSRDLVAVMAEARDAFDEIDVDRLCLRPIVRVIGEFWAQTTDGDGNYRMVEFLEGEHAEAYVDRSVGTRIMYIFHMARQMARAKKGIDRYGRRVSWKQPRALLRNRVQYVRKMALLALGGYLYRRENNRLITALSPNLHEIIDQRELHRLAQPYYDWRCASGEGHLEVGENIYYQTHDLCHMVLSLKPFGCMPSTQSDGAQAAVLEDHTDMNYLPIETSGDSEILAYSRVQMALGNARTKARKELQAALDSAQLDEEDLRAYIESHRELMRPSYRVPKRKGIVGRAALLALHVADLIRRDDGVECDEVTLFNMSLHERVY